MLEIVEGKDRPKELPKPMHHERGKTIGLMIRLCKLPFNTGKVVIFDSGFCILEGLIELRKKGVFGSKLILLCLQLLYFEFG